MSSFISFVKTYIKSMRLPYSFLTGLSGWIGVYFYQRYSHIPVTYFRQIIILTILFLSWGVNQIINDLLGKEEDKINAPNRPSVSGELNSKLAIATTSIILFMMLVVSYFLSPLSLIPAILGILLNIIYQYAKSYSLLGNLVFGLMMSMCSVYGFFACGAYSYDYLNRIVIAVLYNHSFPNNITLVYLLLSLVILISGTMTFFTYFKDIKGDKQAGKNTFIVNNGLKISGWFGILLSVLILVFWLYVLIKQHVLLSEIENGEYFIITLVISIILQFWTSWLYFKNPTDDKFKTNILTNIRACCAGYCSIISIINPLNGLILLIVSFFLTGILFKYQTNI